MRQLLLCGLSACLCQRRASQPCMPAMCRRCLRCQHSPIKNWLSVEGTGVKNRQAPGSLQQWRAGRPGGLPAAPANAQRSPSAPRPPQTPQSAQPGTRMSILSAPAMLFCSLAMLNSCKDGRALRAGCTPARGPTICLLGYATHLQLLFQMRLALCQLCAHALAVALGSIPAFHGSAGQLLHTPAAVRGR